MVMNRRYIEAFKAADANGDGKLTKDELIKSLSTKDVADSEIDVS